MKVQVLDRVLRPVFVATYDEVKSIAQRVAAKMNKVKQYPKTTTDFVADTIDGENVYRLDIQHDLAKTAYLWQCFKTDNNAGVIVITFNQGPNVLKLWFTNNTHDVTINIAS